MGTVEKIRYEKRGGGPNVKKENSKSKTTYVQKAIIPTKTSGNVQQDTLHTTIEAGYWPLMSPFTDSLKGAHLNKGFRFWRGFF